jgi:uncharacterized protein
MPRPGKREGRPSLLLWLLPHSPQSRCAPRRFWLNIVEAAYATWRLHRRGAVDLKLLLPLTAPSLVTAFAGGLLVLAGQAYFILTGLLLVAAAVLMVVKRAADAAEEHQVHFLPAVAVAAGAGFISGLTGVGGGVFLTPVLIAAGWVSPKRAAALSPPFILCNSVVGLIGAQLAGQTFAAGTLLYSVGALAGAVIGTVIGLRWMSERTTRYVLAVILLFAGFRLLLR